MESKTKKKTISKVNAKKGFTLVELIVVVAILGILAAIAIPRFSQYVSQAKWEKTNANALTVYRAMAAVEADLIEEGVIQYPIPNSSYFQTVNDTFVERVQAMVPSSIKIGSLFNPEEHNPEDDNNTYYILYNPSINTDRTPYGVLTVGVKLTNWTNPYGYTAPITTFYWQNGEYTSLNKPY